MPPRKGPRNIVSSGSAGNSSKSKPKAVNPDDIPDGPPRPPPLFPLGYKTPIQLLNEKCRKAGWENPSVTSHPNRGGGGADGAQTYTATVTLKKRRNKNAMDFDTVRFVPVPPIEQTDAALARHFGATYALFRVSYYGSGVRPGPPEIHS
jgi:ATP-dependent RNA helicase DHX57